MAVGQGVAEIARERARKHHPVRLVSAYSTSGCDQSSLLSIIGRIHHGCPSPDVVDVLVARRAGGASPSAKKAGRWPRCEAIQEGLAAKPSRFERVPGREAF
jgi:hypothetical protein